MDDDEELTAEELDDIAIPPAEFKWALVLADWLSNTGTIIDQIAEYPNSLCRRIHGHFKWKYDQEVEIDEAVRGIEQIEQHANGGKNA